MKKDLLIKIVFVISLAISIYFIVSGLTSSDTQTPGGNNNEVLEQDLQVSTGDVNLKVGETYQVTATIIPENATYKTITWRSTNPNVATVDEGLITGVGAGNCTVSVTSEKRKIKKIINVKVSVQEIPVERIIINNTKIELYIGDTAKIEYSIEPANATNTKIIFRSENKNVAAFTQDKLVIGLTEGTTNIILSSSNGIEEKVEVVVKQKTVDVTSVKLNKDSITVEAGKSETLKATIKPSNATDKTITWESSDNNIATVSDGKVTGVKGGEATITAKANNGQSATCKVTVTDAYPAITDDSKYHQGFSLVDSYSSDTFKFRIQKKNDADFVLIWVKDANKQWNSSIPQFGKAFNGENNMSSLISSKGYQNKGLVATNGSFFWDGWGDTPCTPFIINHGKILRDIENKKYGRVYGTLGMTKEGMLKSYSFESNNYEKNKASKQQMLDDGVRNDFAYATMPISEDGTPSSSTNDRNNRTILCQINKNNFVIYSGGSMDTHSIAVELKNTFGCKVAYNLDGGGSRKLYYKTGSMSSAKRIFGGSRAVADMMYFVEQ